MLPDNKTFVVFNRVQSDPDLLRTPLPTKRFGADELEFKPSFLAAQGDKLFVATKGTAQVHVLEGRHGERDQGD